MALSPVLVLGAGVIGLSSAIRLREKGHSVRLWAKRFSPYTTSDISAAIWYPYKAAPEDQVRRWGIESLAEFVELSKREGGGVFLCPGKKYFYRPMGDPWWAKEVPAYRRLEKGELGVGQRDGYAFTLPVADMSHYLPYLRRRLEGSGGILEEREVTSLDEALEACPLVVNCTGLGSRELAKDENLYPIRGIVVLTESLPLPEFTMATDYPKGMIYVIPRRESCILGGVAEDNRWEETATEEESARIHERCLELLPNLGHLKIIGTKVGLRPGREAIRLEVEDRSRGRVIHNYGHGGSGMTLSWGCADEVVQRV